MSAPAQNLDVWLVESNAVYKGVPFNVVTDWVQQGRLLDDDRVRSPSATDWTRLAELPALAAYLPKPEPFRADDRAEALEPVELDITWKKRRSDDDDDVDMIPLIDVSLVLLIFFMLTATVGGAAGIIPTPKTQHGELVKTPYWIGIDCKRDSNGQPVRDAKGEYVPVYSLGQGDDLPDRDDWNLTTQEELLKRLDAKLNAGAMVEVRVKGHPLLRGEIITHDLMVALEKFKVNRKIGKAHSEVSGRDGQ